MTFSFASADADILFTPDLDHLNFRELPAGTPLGTVNGIGRVALEVRDEVGHDVVDRYFRLEDRRICLRRAVMPSMLTVDENVIRQDCLCYLMERYDSHLHDAD